MKLAVAGLLAGLADEQGRHRYRLEYGIVRASGLGEWRAAVDDILNGPAKAALRSAARVEQQELNTKFRVGDEAWQVTAVRALHEACAAVDADFRPYGPRVYGRQWFEYFNWLRNRTRGHGAPTAGLCARVCPLLEESVLTLANGFHLFQRPWAHVTQQLSGLQRTIPLSTQGVAGAFPEDVPTSGSGIFVLFDEPRPVRLVDADPGLADFYIANGSYKDGRFELLSYLRDERRTGDGHLYTEAPGRLPESETEGAGSLRLMGESFTNLPELPREYVERPELEAELLPVLRNDRHPVVTLQGAGGIGKTSLGLKALTDLTESGRFVAILWFSARDIDLLPEGPKSVRPHVLTVDEVAKEFARLLADEKLASQEGSSEREFLGEVMARGLDGEPVLFAFDNFETASDPSGLYRWIDTYIRTPNKVLVTTRRRDFKGDYPIEVGGMKRSEFSELISATAATNGVSELVDDAYIEDLYTESQGHPYVGKVLLGELARSKKKRPVKRIMASRDDILDALFERTFATLPEEAQRIFLTLSLARTLAPAVVIEAVVLRQGNERVDVEAALDLLRRSSFIEISLSDLEDVQVPVAAAVFGEKRARVSPFRAQLERDAELLRGVLGPSAGGDIDRDLTRLIDEFAARVAAAAVNRPAALDDYLPILEFMARREPDAWLAIAEIHESCRPGWLGYDLAAAAIRNYLEARSDPDVWRWLAGLYEKNGDRVAAVTALIERAELPDVAYADVSYAATRLTALLADVDDHDIAEEEQQRLAKRLLQPLVSRAAEADATDLSRIAWLYIRTGERALAADAVATGLKLEPENRHCLKLSQRLPVRADNSPPVTPSRPLRRHVSRTGGAAASVTDPRLREAIRGVQIPTTPSLDDAARAARTVIHRVVEEPSFAEALSEGGIPLVAFAPAVRETLKDTSLEALGFLTIKPFVLYALAETNYCLVEKPGEDPPQPWLVRRTPLPVGTVPVTGTAEPEPNIHSAGYYRALLARGNPVIRLPDPVALYRAVDACASEPPVEAPLADVIEQVVYNADGTLKSGAARLSILAMVSSGAFDRTPPEAQVRDQRLTLKSELADTHALLGHLKEAAAQKIQQRLGSASPTVLAQLFTAELVAIS